MQCSDLCGPACSGAMNSLHCSSLHYSTLHWTTLHCPAQNFPSELWAALHCTTAHCTSLDSSLVNMGYRMYGQAQPITGAAPLFTLQCTALHCAALYLPATLYYIRYLQGPKLPSALHWLLLITSNMWGRFCREGSCREGPCREGSFWNGSVCKGL